MRAVAGTALAASLLLAPGCACYWEDRGLDLMDSWRFRVLGVGFHAGVRATHFLQAGLGMGIPGMEEGNGMGMVGRHVSLKAYPSFIAEAGLAPLAHIRIADDASRGIVLGRTSFDDYPMPKPSWTFKRSPIAYRRRYHRGLFEVGGSLYWIIGLDFGFDPLEFADFMLGFAALDIMEDDVSSADQETRDLNEPKSLPEDHPQRGDDHEEHAGPQPVVGVERGPRAG